MMERKFAVRSYMPADRAQVRDLFVEVPLPFFFPFFKIMHRF
jgi:hypothetical protein